MWMKIAPVALGLVLNACPFGSEPVAGYARIEGTVRMADGSAYRGSVFVFCGEGGQDTGTNAHGRYAVEYTVRSITAGERLPGATEGEFRQICRVSAPGNRPPFARRYETVTFTRARGDRVTTEIDLVEGEVETEPQPFP
jgi:hypothetical protein